MSEAQEKNSTNSDAQIEQARENVLNIFNAALFGRTDSGAARLWERAEKAVDELVRLASAPLPQSAGSASPGWRAIETANMATVSNTAVLAAIQWWETELSVSAHRHSRLEIDVIRTSLDALRKIPASPGVDPLRGQEHEQKDDQGGHVSHGGRDNLGPAARSAASHDGNSGTEALEQLRKANQVMRDFIDGRDPSATEPRLNFCQTCGTALGDE